MIQQRIVNLNPSADRLEVVKITYPEVNSRRSGWRIQPMRFIHHIGRASTMPGPLNSSFIHRPSATANAAAVGPCKLEQCRNADAQFGSDKLARETNASIQNYACKHRITPGEAEWLLLNSGGCIA